MSEARLPMNDAHELDAEQRAEEIAEAYIDQLQRGELPDRAAFLAAHPDIAEALARQLDFVDLMYRTKQAVAGTDTSRAASSLALPEPEPALSAPPHPDRIGRYHILETLGRGAAGTVYRAYDPKFDRDVALKVLRSDRPMSMETIQRFEREARIVAQLRHPSIVPFHEIGEADGFRYLDMELIAGETLEQRLTGAPLDFRESAELVQKLAAALDYAHSLGIVHRDVKPSNILVAVSDQRSAISPGSDSAASGLMADRCLLTAVPQLTDFGLAHRAAGEATLTEEGQIIGTLAYMSPEQAQGGAHQVDGRTDVYSLGAVLYRLLTGRVPFPDGDSFTAQLYQIAHMEPPKPRSLNAAVPRDLETICLKAMAKEPAARFATAAAFAEELRHWLNDEPLHVRPPTVWERTRRWARRNRLAARVTVAATFLLIVVGGSLGGGMAWLQQKRGYEAQVREILEASRAELQCWALLDRARQRLRLPTQGRRLEAQKILQEIAEPLKRITDDQKRERFILETRSVYAATLGVPDLRVDHAELPRKAFLVWRAALQPDGKAMAIGTHLGPVPWTRGQPLQLPKDLDVNQPHPRLAYSRDGKYLAFAPADSGLEIRAGADLGRTLGEWKPTPKSPVLAISFTTDGKTVWVCTAKGQVQALSLPKLEEVNSWQVKVTAEPLTAAVFNNRTTRLAVGDPMGRVLLYGMDAKQLRPLPTARLEVQALAWSPDSRLLAVGTKDGTVQLWHTDNGIPSHRLSVPAPGVSGIQFHPNARWVLAGGRVNATPMWDVATGEQVLTVPYVPWGFARDGHSFVGGSDRRVAFCDLLVPQALRQLTGHHTSVEQLAWSRDNQHLVSLNNQFEVHVWDLNEAVLVDSFQAPPGDFWAHEAAVAISDDARHVAYASGGNWAAAAVMRDINSKKLDSWPLPGGYEQLTFANGKFLLAREEDVGEVKDDKPPDAKRITHGVTYEWTVGKPPVKLREIRPSQAEDWRRFLSHGLTPDGRYYWWLGPRRPEANRRVEVREVATGRLVTRVDRLTTAGAFFSVDGRYWGICSPYHTRLYDLTGTNPPPSGFEPSVLAYSPVSRWQVFAIDSARSGGIPRLGLRLWGEERTWLELDDAHLPGETQTFSHDGRYLAWCSESGTITVADLPALQKEIGEFEKILLAK